MPHSIKALMFACLPIVACSPPDVVTEALVTAEWVDHPGNRFSLTVHGRERRRASVNYQVEGHRRLPFFSRGLVVDDPDAGLPKPNTVLAVREPHVPGKVYRFVVQDLHGGEAWPRPRLRATHRVASIAGAISPNQCEDFPADAGCLARNVTHACAFTEAEAALPAWLERMEPEDLAEGMTLQAADVVVPLSAISRNTVLRVADGKVRQRILQQLLALIADQQLDPSNRSRALTVFSWVANDSELAALRVLPWPPYLRQQLMVVEERDPFPDCVGSYMEGRFGDPLP